jgi:hypothetical protein
MLTHKIFATLLVGTVLMTSMPVAAASPGALTATVPVEGDGVGIEGTISCGGIAPLQTSCSASTVVCCQIHLTMSPGIGFTGTLTENVRTATGSFTFSCNIVAFPLAYTCSQAISGGFYVGQALTMTGTTSSTAVGTWQVSFSS